MNNTKFNEKYNSILEKAIFYSIKARREGILSLQDYFEEEWVGEDVTEKYFQQKDIFELGIMLVINGIESRIVDKILTNLISFETDNSEKTLKNMQKEAVLSIHNGDPTRLLIVLLESFVNFEIGDTEKIYNDVEERFRVNTETEDTYSVSAEELAQLAKEITLFEDMVLLDDKSRKLVLDDIEDMELGKALKNVNFEIQDCVFRIISEERANNIKMIMGEIRWQEVEDAQEKIVKHIRNYFDVDP